ncbi:MAG TPA: hypothetical protein VF622_03330 [Segetibacter sp.]|jgi:hypothetical protein
MKHTFLLLSIVCAFTFFGCSKKLDEDPLASLRANLTGHLWKISSTVMVTASGEQPQSIPNCKKDNLWEYKTDGSFAVYPGSILCNSSEVTLYGTWELLNNGKSLKITIPNAGSYTDEVRVLEATKLQLAYTTNNLFIDTYVSN